MTPSERAELEEERDHLLASLDDLEREHAEGDVDDIDYESLKDAYTARAAAVLRRLGEGIASADAEPVPESRSKSRSRTVLWVVALVAVAGVAATLVTRYSGERAPGQQMSGNIDNDSVSGLLAQARAQLAPNAPEASMALYAQVLELEPDNSEALTYLGWLSALSARSIEDDDAAAERFQTGLILLRQATTVDETYPDPHCFIGVLFFRFLGDSEAAQPEFERCLELDPPAEARSLVESALADLKAQSSDSTPDSSPDTTVADG